MIHRHALLRLAALAALLVAANAQAHDSWIVDGPGALTMVTGSRYPLVDLTVPAESIVRQACAKRTCWTQLRPFDIELEPRLVDVYFRDAHPSGDVQSRWQALHARGVAWRERYRKFARIERDPGAPSTRPAGMDLELLPAAPAALRSGAQARFVLLSNGKPLAEQPVELVSDRSPLGVWSRTDAQGQVAWTLPFAARWLVRTIVIEPAEGDAWQSRFATLVFDAK